MKTYVTTAYFALSFYVFGCLAIENDVNYATWYQLSAGCFHSYHQVLESFLRLFMFTPMGLQLLVNGLLLWRHPANLPRWTLVVTFLLNGYIIAESLLIQVPVHQALEEQFSTALLDQLLLRHRTLRLPAELLVAGLNGWLLHRVIHASSVTSR